MHSFVVFSIKNKEPKLILYWRMGLEELSSSARWSQDLAVLFTFWSMDEASKLGKVRGTYTLWRGGSQASAWPAEGWEEHHPARLLVHD